MPSVVLAAHCSTAEGADCKDPVAKSTKAVHFTPSLLIGARRALPAMFNTCRTSRSGAGTIYLYQQHIRSAMPQPAWMTQMRSTWCSSRLVCQEHAMSSAVPCFGAQRANCICCYAYAPNPFDALYRFMPPCVRIQVFRSPLTPLTHNAHADASNEGSQQATALGLRCIRLCTGGAYYIVQVRLNVHVNVILQAAWARCSM